MKFLTITDTSRSGHRSRRLFTLIIYLTAFIFASLQTILAVTAQPVKKLMIFGDSLTAGYGLKKKESFSEKLAIALKGKGLNIRILLSSISGDTTAGGRSRLDWALAEKPDAFILELGANDSLRGIDPSVTRNNLEIILKKLKKNDVKILMAGMLAPPNLGKEYSIEFNSIYSSLAKKYNILLYPFFLEGVAAVPKLNQKDGIHPNSAGVDEIVRRILPIVMKLVE